MKFLLWWNVVFRANVTNRAEHCLEIFELSFDLLANERFFGFRPSGDHDASCCGLRFRQSALRSDRVEPLPDVFRDERRHRVQQSQDRVKRMRQNALRNSARRWILQTAFDHFQIETAKLIPGEVVEQ